MSFGLGRVDAEFSEVASWSKATPWMGRELVFWLGVLAFVVSVSGFTVAGELPSRNPFAPDHPVDFEPDYLDETNYEPRASGRKFVTGESVDLYNGNLRVLHPSTPIYPRDGRLTLGLARSYNSKKASKETVRFHEGTEYRERITGDSWVGFGWRSHLGRVYKEPVYEYSTVTNDWVYRHRTYFEMPDGTSYRFKPSTSKRSGRRG